MRYILLCHIHVLICLYSSQEAVFRTHLFLTLYLIFQVITLPFRNKLLLAQGQSQAYTTVAVEAIKFEYVLMSVIKAGHFSERWLLTYKTADISSGSASPHRGAFMCPVKTACRELIRGTGGSVASCWWHIEACTPTTPRWWRKSHSSSRLH